MTDWVEYKITSMEHWSHNGNAALMGICEYDNAHTQQSAHILVPLEITNDYGIGDRIKVRITKIEE